MAKRVLLAEDEPNIVASLEFLLGRAGYEIVAYSDGAEALSAIKANPPDIEKREQIFFTWSYDHVPSSPFPLASFLIHRDRQNGWWPDYHPLLHHTPLTSSSTSCSFPPLKTSNRFDLVQIAFIQHYSFIVRNKSN